MVHLALIYTLTGKTNCPYVKAGGDGVTYVICARTVNGYLGGASGCGSSSYSGRTHK